PGVSDRGFWWVEEGIMGRPLELVKEVASAIARVGIVFDPDDANTTEPLKVLPVAARSLGLAMRVIEARSSSDFETMFAIAANENLQGLQVAVSPLFISHRTEVTALAARARLPVVYGIREFALAAGLMSYGTSLPDIYRNKARLVDKILKGASPTDLPIERPTKFELAINLKTAKALGLAISEALLLRADEVIE